jgi:hypothetical protein
VRIGDLLYDLLLTIGDLIRDWGATRRPQLKFTDSTSSSNTSIITGTRNGILFLRLFEKRRARHELEKAEPQRTAPDRQQ